MALVKTTLETQILAILTDLSKRTDNQVKSNEDFARLLSTAIDAYIKTAVVNVTVTTTGTAAAHTGTGVGTLS